ncbi:MAG: VanZ family protein [Neisseriaceae bacterium]|nr:VanZ family protein [Neisseriaceae bacterium]
MTQKNKYFLFAYILWFLLSCYGLFSEADSSHSGFLSQIISFLNLDQTNWAIDKIAHFSMFYIQAILIFYSFHPFKKTSFIYIIILLIVWAFLSEQLQSILTMTRHKDLYDVMADSLGILFACIFFLYVERKTYEPKSQSMQKEN